MSSKNAVELKGGMYTFLSLRVHSTDIDAIDAALADKVHQAPAFFKNTPIVVDLADLELREQALENGDDSRPDDDSSSLIDASALLECIRRHNLQPIVASSSNKSSRLANAIALPLVEVEARRRTASASSANGGSTAADKADSDSRAANGADAQTTGIQDDGEKASIASDTDASHDETGASDTDASRADDPFDSGAGEIEYVVKAPILIDRPVRSGQQIYARDTDLIVMGQVGPGAEVIADNNIHVYGPLRGRALCGVSGNTATRIFCQSLEAELVSVAGTYRMLETIPEELRGKPAQIWLDNDRLNIEPM